MAAVCSALESVLLVLFELVVVLLFGIKSATNMTATITRTRAMVLVNVVLDIFFTVNSFTWLNNQVFIKTL